MRPVTAPCSHDPPTLQEILRCLVGMRSPEQDPPDKASDRPLMRPVTVALSSHPDKKPVPPSGGYPDPAQRPEGAPLQGAKVTNRISGESEPLMRRADESLSVSHVPASRSLHGYCIVMPGSLSHFKAGNCLTLLFDLVRDGSWDKVEGYAFDLLHGAFWRFRFTGHHDLPGILVSMRVSNIAISSQVTCREAG